ncbi:MAG: DUF4465 domain-containing protein [Bacteroidales bacterium]|nr:DUF4465 domain-containing protein [Bacteroidales bacterium]
MKRLFFILFSLMMVVSCLDDGSGMGQTYTTVADFEYGNNVQFLPDSTFFNTKQPAGFGYDVLNFCHQLDPTKSRVEGGFLLSCLEMPKSGNIQGLNNTYRLYASEPEKYLSNTYTVYYQNPEPAFMPAHDIVFPLTENGKCKIVGFYVTNTAAVAEYVKENFKEGDNITLKATGYLGATNKGTIEMKLVDFTEKKDSIVSSWTPFEIDDLGYIEYVDFEITSTQPNTPAYFCMDMLVYSVELEY